MKNSLLHEKMMATYHLLSQDSISLGIFEHVRVVLKGIHPDLDRKLDICSKALDAVQKLQSGDVISFTAEHLPEKSEDEKKRKKALIFLITNIKNLQSEIKRIDSELSQVHSSSETIWHFGRIIKFAKGPFGLITLIALVIVGFIFVLKHPSSSSLSKSSISPTGKSIQIITYSGKQIPINQLFVGHGPDCDAPHYHAIGETNVIALDGTIIKDPGNCGFGRVQDMKITTVQQ